jgi:hypothetical protein
MRVIADITIGTAGTSTVQAWHTLAEMRAAIRPAARAHGPITADLYRWPAGVESDPFGLDVPTWRIIRTPEQFIRTEMFQY